MLEEKQPLSPILVLLVALTGSSGATFGVNKLSGSDVSNNVRVLESTVVIMSKEIVKTREVLNTRIQNNSSDIRDINTRLRFITIAKKQR